MSDRIEGWGYEVATGKHAGVDLYYPDRARPSDTYVVVGLMDIRASGSVRLWYDFERDGFVIERQTRYEWKAADTVCDPGWEFAAFVPAPLPDQK